jgi:hypothetical protein
LGFWVFGFLGFWVFAKIKKPLQYKRAGKKVESTKDMSSTGFIIFWF